MLETHFILTPKILEYYITVPGYEGAIIHGILTYYVWTRFPYTSSITGTISPVSVMKEAPHEEIDYSPLSVRARPHGCTAMLRERSASAKSIESNGRISLSCQFLLIPRLRSVAFVNNLGAGDDRKMEE